MAIHSSHIPLDIPAGKTMLDAVMFAAGLVSKSSEIDKQLDRVRSITAQRSADQLTKEDARTLHEVYEYLEDYLVEKEPLRAFTHETVREKVSGYLHGNESPTHSRQPLVLMWIIAVGGALGAAMLPDALVSATVKLTLAITIFFVTINLGAAWMFWSGLQNFKDKIRQAYLPICVGIALVSLTLLFALFAVITGQDTSVLFRYVVSGLVIPVAEVLMYVGMRRFAQIGGVTSKFMSAKLVFLLCAGASVLVAIIPRPESNIADWIVIFSLSLLTTGAVLSAVTAWITAIVRQSLSQVYKRPMAWFMAVLLATVFSCILYAVMQIVATAEHPFDPRGIGLLPLVVSGFLTLGAGVSFRQIGVAATPRNRT